MTVPHAAFAARDLMSYGVSQGDVDALLKYAGTAELFHKETLALTLREALPKAREH